MIPIKQQLIYLSLITSTLFVMLSFQNCTTVRPGDKSVLTQIHERKTKNPQAQSREERSVTLTKSKPASQKNISSVSRNPASTVDEFTVELRERPALKPEVDKRSVASGYP
ncbi:MAG: hypothetical protein COT74_10455 [Bdellovibrionales bacterium CG10_big_fil_rev_8_21_14_0_10_45_34]|nr:MAG: hypothetical protein COT74_10455 [Bdellovibrionales bacterium CG10_big_fil_rev_8_21_14_0_10_45_34]